MNQCISALIGCTGPKFGRMMFSHLHLPLNATAHHASVQALMLLPRSLPSVPSYLE